MAEKQKFSRMNAPTKDQLREMLAQAVRNTQPQLNAIQPPEKGKRRPRAKS